MLRQAPAWMLPSTSYIGRLWPRTWAQYLPYPDHGYHPQLVSSHLCRCTCEASTAATRAATARTAAGDAASVVAKVAARAAARAVARAGESDGKGGREGCGEGDGKGGGEGAVGGCGKCGGSPCDVCGGGGGSPCRIAPPRFQEGCALQQRTRSTHRLHLVHPLPPWLQMSGVARLRLAQHLDSVLYRS